MKFVVRVKANMGKVKIPHLKQQHACDRAIRSISDTAYMVELRKALKAANPENWKSAYPGGKTYSANDLPNNFNVLESGFFFTIEITI